MNTILNKLLDDVRNNLYEVAEIHIEEDVKFGKAKVKSFGTELLMEYEPKLEIWIIK